MGPRSERHWHQHQNQHQHREQAQPGLTTLPIPARQFALQVNICRCIAITLLFFSYQYHDQLSEHIQRVYHDVIQPSYIFRHESFEPLLSTVYFFIIIMFWLVVDKYILPAAPILYQYRICTGNKQSIYDNSAWRGRSSAFGRETLWYIAPWLVIDQFYKRRVVPETSPTLSVISWQILKALWVYDLLFFIGHYTMHHSSWLYRHVHSEHHTSPVVRATDTIRHTFLDGSWDVLCSVLALNLTRAHPLSRALYNIVVISFSSLSLKVIVPTHHRAFITFRPSHSSQKLIAA